MPLENVALFIYIYYRTRKRVYIQTQQQQKIRHREKFNKISPSPLFVQIFENKTQRRDARDDGGGCGGNGCGGVAGQSRPDENSEWNAAGAALRCRLAVASVPLTGFKHSRRMPATWRARSSARARAHPAGGQMVPERLPAAPTN